MVNKEGVKFDIGANPSAEGADDDEGVEDRGECVNDVLDTFRLQPTSFDKKSYMIYIKGYMKKLKEHLAANHPERVDKFQSAAQAFVKRILENFDDYSFYVGESMDPEAMVVIMGYYENGVDSYVYLFKDGVKTIKMASRVNAFLFSSDSLIVDS